MVDRIDEGPNTASPDVAKTEPSRSEALYCTWHPKRETLLRCARCSKPMCPDCAHQHPVGLRCKECRKELRSPLYQVSAAEGIRAALAAGLLSMAATLLVSLVSSFGMIIGLIVAAFSGSYIADLASAAGGRKRGRGIQIATVVGMVIGIGMLWTLMRIPELMSMLPPRLRFNLLSPLLMLVLGIPMAFRQLK